ncbi:hypothetical protein MAR_035905 [Mya arenaria]|uniref:Uncharacterized protein n=1 Tax=Mya arenaria TaxID=6604 RepID=A0ABY7EP14_MYAAR|nr:hypothetical protein MAR_035905 [Mya arenaria]
MASFEDYTKWFERKENGNWLKVSLETDQLHIERTDVLAAIKDVVTSLERLTSSTDAETLADNIKKFRDIQQEIAAEAEEHKRDICDFVDAKKDDLTHHANVSISDIDKRIEANQQSLNELKTEVKEHKRDIGELADRKKADLTQYAKELILDIDQKLEADQQSLNVFKKVN